MIRDNPLIAGNKMNRGFYPVMVLAAGMLSAQVLGTVQVYLSNAEVYQMLVSLQEHGGYLLVPNRKIMEGLNGYAPAFFGGVFFTLSLGAALSSITFGSVWAWDRLFSRSKLILILFLMVLPVCIYQVNRLEFSPIVTAYFLVVPAVTAVAAMKLMPAQSGRIRIVHIASFIVIALLCISQLDKNIFVNFRDNFFLSNPIGMEMNDFYYKYTLYPAEIIKPLDQQTLKTFRFKDEKNIASARPLERALLNYNYLNVGEGVAADLVITEEGDDLRLLRRGLTVLSISTDNFLSAPGTLLKDFSIKSDKYAFFREIIFYSIITGLPLIVYIVLYSLFRSIASYGMNSIAAAAVAALLCVVVGAAFVVPLELNKEGTVGVDRLKESLQSGRWQTRVAALKVIEKNGLELTGFAPYHGMLESTPVAERYWLVRALGTSRRPETLKDLQTFLDDPHPNVVSMAFYSLGRRGDTGVVKEIIERIKKSDHWYEQLYAYNALMELGWRQNR